MNAAPKTDFARLLPPLLERAREGDRRAEDEIICLCWPLARYVARKRYQPGYDPEFEDLESACLLALIRSVRKWRPDEAAFTTYAHRAMWNACNRAVKQAQEFPERPISLDNLVRGEEGDEERLEERIHAATDTEADGIRSFLEVEMRVWIERELEGRPHFKRALELRYGLDGKGVRTVAEIAEEFGCSNTRASQMIYHALRHLRRSGYASAIWNGIED